MALRVVVVVPVFEAGADVGYVLLINACADVATSAQAAACSKRCALAMIIVLYAVNYSRDRHGAAAANEALFNMAGRMTLHVILTGFQ